MPSNPKIFRKNTHSNCFAKIVRRIINYYAMHLFVSTQFSHYIINNKFNFNNCFTSKQNSKIGIFGDERYSNNLKTIKVSRRDRRAYTICKYKIKEF